MSASCCSNDWLMRPNRVLLLAGIFWFTTTPGVEGAKLAARMPVPESAQAVGRIDAEARALLDRNGFVVTGQALPKLYLFYDPLILGSAREVAPNTSVSEGLPRPKLTAEPILITTDAMLHAYHRVYCDSLVRIERRQSKELRTWCCRVWNSVASVRGETTFLDEADVVHLLGVFAVARRILEPNWVPPPSLGLPSWVDMELARVHSGRGRCVSDAWGRVIEYRDFVPTGFYTTSDALRRYFKARRWLGSFALRTNVDREARLAAHLAMVSYYDEDYARLRTWVTALLGYSEDPDLADLWRLFQAETEREDGKMTGEAARSRLRRVLRHIEGAHPRAIRQAPPTGLLSDRVFGVYILAPAYTADSHILTCVTSPPHLNRRVPSGLDVIAALGSSLAEQLSLARTKEPVRPHLRHALGETGVGRPDDMRVAEPSAMTIEVIKALVSGNVGENAPPFMRSKAYRAKSLQTALAVWAEHRSNWRLHTKRPIGLFGKDAAEAPAGFVEPHLAFWDRLLQLAIVTRHVLDRCGAGGSERWDLLVRSVCRCRMIAADQLADRPFSRPNRQFLRQFGQTLERLCSADADGAPSPETDALVVEVYRRVGRSGTLYVGVGLPRRLYAWVPHRGKTWLCAGGVMTYREHFAEDDAVIAESKWRLMLPDMPVPGWLRAFTTFGAGSSVGGAKRMNDQPDG